MTSELIARLEEIERDHLRMASWNQSRDRAKRVAFHHDAAAAIRSAIRTMKASTAASDKLGGYAAGVNQNPGTKD